MAKSVLGWVYTHTIDAARWTSPRLYRWGWNTLLASDQFINAILCGWCDETLSARLYRTSRSIETAPFGSRVCFSIAYFCRLVLDIIFLLLSLGRSKGHCKSSYEWEQQRRDLPIEYRNSLSGLVEPIEMHDTPSKPEQLDESNENNNL